MTLDSRRLRALVFGLVLLLALAGCGSGEEGATETPSDDGTSDDGTAGEDGADEDPTEGDDGDAADDGPEARSGRPLRIAGPEPSQGFDPAVAVADSSRIRMGLMFSKLVEYDQDGEIVGALAEDWELSEDGLLWTFNLRDTARFSDGAQVTAEDVVFSLEYVLDSEVGDVFPEITEVRAADESTVEFELPAPAGRQLLLALVREGTAGIVSKAAVEAAGGPQEYFANPTATSGPFALEEYLPASHLTYVANEYFWREGYPKSQGLEITFQDDPQAMLAGLRTGTFDMVGVPYENVAEMEADPAFETYQSDGLTPTFWGIDHSKPPFDSQEVRQAFAHAVDREGPRNACWYGTGAVSHGNMLRPWTEYYVEIDTYSLPREESFERAGELLDEAGWVDDGSGTRVAEGVEGVEDGTPLSVTVPFESNWPAAECNTLILQQTFREIGVEIVPEAYDPAAFWGDVAEGEMTMWHGGAGSPDPESFFADWFHSDGLLTPLTTRLDDPEIDEMVTEGLTTPDLDRAAEIFTELEVWQAEWVPLIVIGYQFQTAAATVDLKDYWVAFYAGSRPETEAYIAE